jgi:protocatechuate 3,4-dioxygenase beta subunit
MHNDDAPIGRILSRREVLALLGAAGAGLVASRATGQTASLTTLVSPSARAARLAGLPACVVRPKQTEGPYFVDEKLNRSDIRVDPSNGRVPEGVPLDLEVRVSRVSGDGCAPLPGAMVDLWQCDAVGVYSDVRDTNNLFNTVGQKFLRGYQLTGPDGVARFRSIFPGWYQGRTAHVHFKVRTERGGRTFDFTSQLYFDDATADAIYANAPYSANTQRRVKNGGDGIYRQGGLQLLVPLERRGDLVTGAFDIGLTLD